MSYSWEKSSNLSKKFRLTKGQIISKGLFDVLEFSQKMNKRIRLSSKNECVCLFFGRIGGYKKSFRNHLTFTLVSRTVLFGQENKNSHFHNLLPDLHSNPYQLLNQKCLLHELGIGQQTNIDLLKRFLFYSNAYHVLRIEFLFKMNKSVPDICHTFLTYPEVVYWGGSEVGGPAIMSSWTMAWCLNAVFRLLEQYCCFW
jgi:hypothetical protein